MKTHRQELASQLLGQGTNTVGAETGSLPTANEPSVVDTVDTAAYSQEVELIEVTCAADVHLNQALQNQALQTTHMAISGQLKTALPPPYQQSNTDELHRCNMVQQPAVIHDYRNTMVPDLQLQNVFAPQVCSLTIIIIIIIHEYYYVGAVALLLQDHLTMSVSRFAG